MDDVRPGELILPDPEAHHAAHVLRLKTGAPVELFDGRGGSGEGQISRCKRGEVVVTVRKCNAPTARPLPLVHLGFAVPKGKRVDWLLEKATELGATSLRPICFERSVAGGEKLSDSQRKRWISHCIAGAKQCGGDFLPEIRDPYTVQDFIIQTPHSLRIFGDTDASAVPVQSALRDYRNDCETDQKSTMTALVGPEGGLTEQERQCLISEGFRPVRIGRTTLRIETASIAVLAIIMDLHRSDG